MFRYERMKTGRYRQFYQIGAEAYGVEGARAGRRDDGHGRRSSCEALGLTDVSLNLNSLGDDACRPAYQREAGGVPAARTARSCARTASARLETNPLRVLDCKNESCQADRQRGAQHARARSASRAARTSTTCSASWTLLGIRYVVNPRMVRGLDYYTRTAFEFIAAHPALGTASTVGGGGRYDKLVKSLGGPDVPAVGFAPGVGPAGAAARRRAASSLRTPPDLFVAAADEGSQDAAFALVSRLRREGLRVEFDTRGGSLKSQMKRADKTGGPATRWCWARELAERAGQLKPMAGGEARRVGFSELLPILRAQR